jgi:hypothetical protein
MTEERTDLIKDDEGDTEGHDLALDTTRKPKDQDDVEGHDLALDTTRKPKDQDDDDVEGHDLDIGGL